MSPEESTEPSGGEGVGMETVEERCEENIEDKVEEKAEEIKRKKIKDEELMYMQKRSESQLPHYTAKLKAYVNIQDKRRRAEAALGHNLPTNKEVTKRKMGLAKERSKEKTSHRPKQKAALRSHCGLGRSCGNDGASEDDQDKKRHRAPSLSPNVRSRIESPSDACGCRQRRRRRKSCRRRRRSRPRKRRCRRRRRSCSRRRRRRSCCRRRRRRRRRCC